MLRVQEYLCSGKSFDQLFADHGVKANFAPGLVGLNYDQIESSNSDLLAQDCRGLILNAATLDIVAFGFKRFFNFEQVDVAAPIDWNSAKAFEKVDGSLIIVYYFGDKWNCATRGRVLADADAHGANLTFSQLVDKTTQLMSGKSFQDFMAKACRKCTYCFELTSPINRIVCKYDDFKLTLLGVRNIDTLLEENPEDHLDRFEGLSVPKTYDFSSVTDLQKMINEWTPEEHEGVVIRDANFNRVKVKSLAYVAYNHMRDSLTTSWRGCVEVVLAGKDDDVAAMMPEFIAKRIRLVRDSYNVAIKMIRKDYEDNCHHEDMKAFALAIKNCVWPAPLFAVKRGKASSIEEFIFDGVDTSKSKIDSLIDLFKKINPEFLNEYKGIDV